MEALRLPDTLQGAIILSVIDFFLSFVIIAGIGVVLALLPLINRLVTPRGGRRRAARRAHARRAPIRPSSPPSAPPTSR